MSYSLKRKIQISIFKNWEKRKLHRYKQEKGNKDYSRNEQNREQKVEIIK